MCALVGNPTARMTGNYISELSTQDPGLSLDRSTLESFLPSPTRSLNVSRLLSLLPGLQDWLPKESPLHDQNWTFRGQKQSDNAHQLVKVSVAKRQQQQQPSHNTWHRMPRVMAFLFVFISHSRTSKGPPKHHQCILCILWEAPAWEE